MFAIGRPPLVPEPPPRQKRILVPPNTRYVQPVFTGRSSSWLLLPRSDLSFFQRQLERSSANSFTEPYLTSISLHVTFPPYSFAYGMAIAAFPLSPSLSPAYDSICYSMVTAYTANMKVRWAMKKLMNAWRSKHVRLINEEDVATQEAPKKPVVFVNWNTKTSHQFEAMTILRDTVNRLLNHDQLFLHPLPPRNPFTNAPLTYGALISLHTQLRRAGVTHWVWEAFVASNFNLMILEKRYEVPIKLRCLEKMMADKTNYNTIDFVMDFIIGEYTHHAITGPPNEATVLRVLVTKWDAPKVQDWIKLCNKYWMNEIRGRCEENSLVHIKSESLIQSMKGWYAV